MSSDEEGEEEERGGQRPRRQSKKAASSDEGKTRKKKAHKKRKWLEPEQVFLGLEHQRLLDLGAPLRGIYRQILRNGAHVFAPGRSPSDLKSYAGLLRRRRRRAQ